MTFYCIETFNRIRISLAAYTYEVMNVSIMSDVEYDKLAQLIRPSLDTGRPNLDIFFRTQFSPHTGQWIHNHPELDKISEIALRYWDKS